MAPETIVVNKYFVISPDEKLRKCKARPPKPDLKDQIGVALLISDLDERGEDCSSKLGKTWESIDEGKKQVDEKNKEEETR